MFPVDSRLFHCSMQYVLEMWRAGGGKVAQEKYNLINLIEEMSIMSLLLYYATNFPLITELHLDQNFIEGKLN